MSANIFADPKSARAAIATILARHQDLHWAGWGPATLGYNRAGQRNATVADAREETLGPDGVDQAMRAAAWLATVERTQRPTMRHGCYVWKHVAERAVGGYIGEGALIVAALAMGFRYARSGCSTFLNIHPRCYDRGRPMRASGCDDITSPTHPASAQGQRLRSETAGEQPPAGGRCAS